MDRRGAATANASARRVRVVVVVVVAAGGNVGRRRRRLASRQHLNRRPRSRHRGRDVAERPEIAPAFRLTLMVLEPPGRPRPARFEMRASCRTRWGGCGRPRCNGLASLHGGLAAEDGRSGDGLRERVAAACRRAVGSFVVWGRRGRAQTVGRRGGEGERRRGRREARGRPRPRGRTPGEAKSCALQQAASPAGGVVAQLSPWPGGRGGAWPRPRRRRGEGTVRRRSHTGGPSRARRRSARQRRSRCWSRRATPRRKRAVRAESLSATARARRRRGRSRALGGGVLARALRMPLEQAAFEPRRSFAVRGATNVRDRRCRTSPPRRRRRCRGGGGSAAAPPPRGRRIRTARVRPPTGADEATSISTSPARSTAARVTASAPDAYCGASPRRALRVGAGGGGRLARRRRRSRRRSARAGCGRPRRSCARRGGGVGDRREPRGGARRGGGGACRGGGGGGAERDRRPRRLRSTPPPHRAARPRPPRALDASDLRARAAPRHGRRRHLDVAERRRTRRVHHAREAAAPRSSSGGSCSPLSAQRQRFDHRQYGRAIARPPSSSWRASGRRGGGGGAPGAARRRRRWRRRSRTREDRQSCTEEAAEAAQAAEAAAKRAAEDRRRREVDAAEAARPRRARPLGRLWTAAAVVGAGGRAVGPRRRRRLRHRGPSAFDFEDSIGSASSSAGLPSEARAEAAAASRYDPPSRRRRRSSATGAEADAAKLCRGAAGRRLRVRPRCGQGDGAGARLCRRRSAPLVVVYSSSV